MKLYVVCNKEGKFFRPNRGFVKELDRAKFYPKIGQAKGRVTYFCKASPKQPICDILEFNLDPSTAVRIDMTQPTKDALEKRRLTEEAAEVYRKERELAQLEAELEAIQARIDERRKRHF